MPTNFFQQHYIFTHWSSVLRPHFGQDSTEHFFSFLKNLRIFICEVLWNRNFYVILQVNKEEKERKELNPSLLNIFTACWLICTIHNLHLTIQTIRKGRASLFLSLMMTLHQFNQLIRSTNQIWIVPCHH